MKKRLLALISGGGTNLQAVLDAIDRGELDAIVLGVISSNSSAGGLLRAQKKGIPTYVCSKSDYSCLEERDQEILKIAKIHDVDYILLLGYLGILTPTLVNAYKKRIINIHPSLLPKFGGKGFFGVKVHEEVIKAGEKITGATVHYVDEGTDTGEIIMQKSIEVLPGDTPESLQKRVLQIEHILLIEALKKVFNN